MTQYELVLKVYSENKIEINERIGKSKFPITFQVLKYFSLKIADILKSIECIEINQSFYSSQCLSRILYEHFLVAYYIWTKCRVEDSDECALDYTQFYSIYEMIKQENYNSKLDKSYNSQNTPLQNFLIKAPEFDEPKDLLNEENVKEINKKANKFDIRIILKYMQDDLDPNDEYKSIHDLVNKVCKKYNKTSSYIHGGRLAELETFENTPPMDKAKVLKENVEFARLFYCQVLSFIMLLLIYEDKNFIKIYQPIIDLINNTKN